MKMRGLLKLLIFLTPAFWSLTALGVDTADPNHILAFKKIFVVLPQDNVDGTFFDLSQGVMKEFLSVNPRFQPVTQKGSSDGWVQIRIQKKSDHLELECRLVLTLTDEVFALTKQSIDTKFDDVMLRSELLTVVKNTFAKIPFAGAVTGRDGRTVTLDIGSLQGITLGDQIRIGRIQDFKRHPLLKQILDTQVVLVGTARVTQIEEGIAFADVVEEFENQKILPGYKVTAVVHDAFSENPRNKKNVSDLGGGDYEIPVLDPERGPPRYGYADLGIGLGRFSSSTQKGAASVSGDSFLPSFQLRGEAWITDAIFADLGFRGGITNITYTGGSAAGKAGISTSLTAFELNVGYRFYFGKPVYGPSLGLKLGYYNFHLGNQTIEADFLTARTYSGINFGAVGQMPFGKRPFGADLAMSVVLFPGYSERVTVMPSSGSSTVVRFYLGGYYFFYDRLSVRLGLDFESYARDFDSNAAASTQQKIIGFVPSVQYFF